MNNRTFKRCAKCGNWSTTHSTAEHTGGKPSGSNTSQAPSTHLAALDPSMWCVFLDQDLEIPAQPVPLPEPKPSLTNSGLNLFHPKHFDAGKHKFRPPPPKGSTYNHDTNSWEVQPIRATMLELTT